MLLESPGCLAPESEPDLHRGMAYIPSKELKQPSGTVGGGDGKSGRSKTDSERGSSLDVITCYWESKIPEDQSLNAISDLAKGVYEAGDSQPGYPSCSSERDSSLSVISCYWEPKIPEGEESDVPSDGATTRKSGNLHTER